MDGEYDRDRGGHLRQRPEQSRERRRIVHVRRPVQGSERVPLARELEPLLDTALPRARQGREQGIDHHVPDEMHPRRIDPFLAQVLVAVSRRREEQVREPVGEYPVDLLGHGPVARAEPGFDVRDRDAHLRGHQGDGKGTVHVAGHHHHVGPLAREDRLDLDHHPGGLLRVRAAAYPEVHVGLRHSQVLEEHVGHLHVVVLAGVHEDLAHLSVLAQPCQDGRDLHEVRTRADDVKDLHGCYRAHACPAPQLALLYR